MKCKLQDGSYLCVLAHKFYDQDQELIGKPMKADYNKYDGKEQPILEIAQDECLIGYRINKSTDKDWKAAKLVWKVAKSPIFQTQFDARKAAVGQESIDIRYTA